MDSCSYRILSRSNEMHISYLQDYISLLQVQKNCIVQNIQFDGCSVVTRNDIETTI